MTTSAWPLARLMVAMLVSAATIPVLAACSTETALGGGARKVATVPDRQHAADKTDRARDDEAAIIPDEDETSAAATAADLAFAVSMLGASNPMLQIVGATTPPMSLAGASFTLIATVDPTVGQQFTVAIVTPKDLRPAAVEVRRFSPTSACAAAAVVPCQLPAVTPVALPFVCVNALAAGDCTFYAETSAGKVGPLAVHVHEAAAAAPVAPSAPPAPPQTVSPPPPSGPVHAYFESVEQTLDPTQARGSCLQKQQAASAAVCANGPIQEVGGTCNCPAALPNRSVVITDTPVNGGPGGTSLECHGYVLCQ